MIVVCAPQNVTALVDILSGTQCYADGALRFIVQTDPEGPVDALKLGAELCTAGRVMLLCGDNIIDDKTWKRFVDKPEMPAMLIGTQPKAGKEASRFTVCHQDGAKVQFYDGCPIGMYDKTVEIWVGPVIFHSPALKQGLSYMETYKPRAFSSLFTEISNHNASSVTFIDSDAMDIGVPEALR